MRTRKYGDNGDGVEESLARRIHIWAQVWRRCPKKGCRRMRRCLRFHDCAGVSHEPYWPTAKEKRRIWDRIRAHLRAEQGGAPNYDPDERDRNRPLPPPPERTRLSSRPSPEGKSRDPEP